MSRTFSSPTGSGRWHPTATEVRQSPTFCGTTKHSKRRQVRTVRWKPTWLVGKPTSQTPYRTCEEFSDETMLTPLMGTGDKRTVTATHLKPRSGTNTDGDGSIDVAHRSCFLVCESCSRFCSSPETVPWFCSRSYPRIFGFSSRSV